MTVKLLENGEKMAQINLTFIYHNDGAEVDVEIDDTTTGKEVINNLLRESFIPQLPPSSHYIMAVKGGATVPLEQTLQQSGVHEADHIVVSVAPQGG